MSKRDAIFSGGMAEVYDRVGPLFSPFAEDIARRVGGLSSATGSAPSRGRRWLWRRRSRERFDGRLAAGLAIWLTVCLDRGRFRAGARPRDAANATRRHSLRHRFGHQRRRVGGRTGPSFVLWRCGRHGDAAGGLTAAHRTLPFGSEVRIVNLDNGRAVVVRIVDRGPFIHGRIIDVSPAAATSLGFRDAGLAHVKIDLISLEASQSGPRAVQQAVYAPGSTSSSAICRYGADRVENLQSDSDALGCQDLRSRLFLFAQRAEDLAPLAARGGAYLTEEEAAASIPVSAIAEVPEREASATEMEAAASIPVGDLAAVPERNPAPSPSPSAFFFARLRHIFD